MAVVPGELCPRYSQIEPKVNPDLKQVGGIGVSQGMDRGPFMIAALF